MVFLVSVSLRVGPSHDWNIPARLRSGDWGYWSVRPQRLDVPRWASWSFERVAGACCCLTSRLSGPALPAAQRRSVRQIPGMTG